MGDVFNKKYTEFANDLKSTCPELSADIDYALSMNAEERKVQFKTQVLPSFANTGPSSKAPTVCLPGVEMSEEIWASLSDNSKKAIKEYLSILSFTLVLDPDHFGSSAELPHGLGSDWAGKMMEDLKLKMDTIDFKGLSMKMAKMFAGAGGPGGGTGIPQIPEKFMKGQIARLAEDILKEIDINDFGIDPSVLEEANKDPSKAINILMDVFSKNPQGLQNIVAKLGKKIQSKIQSGAIKPAELVKEAEELMATFAENPEFVEMMKGFKNSFGVDEEDIVAARARNDEGSARLSIVKARLRAKLEAKKKGR